MTFGVLVTGSTGFVGRALVANFARQPDVCLRSAIRSSGDATRVLNPVVVGNLGRETDWSAAVSGIRYVVHTAACIKPSTQGQVASLDQYREVNVQGTLALAQQAAAAGVRRFVYISTAKVLGERSVRGRPFVETDSYAPCGDYALSKMEAEQALLSFSQHSEMEVVIVRPPMVYGVDAGGNFSALVKLVQLRAPLPIGAIENLRSFVCITNLVDFVGTCIKHPAAANQIFLVSDAHDVSTPELVRAIQSCHKKTSYLFRIPEGVLRFCFERIGRLDIHQRLCDDLQLDTSKAKQVLQWEPVIRFEDGLMQSMRGLSN